MVNIAIRRLYSRDRTPAPIGHKAGWAQTFGRREKCVVLAGFRSPDCPLRSVVATPGEIYQLLMVG